MASLSSWDAVAADELDLGSGPAAADRGRRIPLLPAYGHARRAPHPGPRMAAVDLRARARARVSRRRIPDPRARREAVLLRAHAPAHPARRPCAALHGGGPDRADPPPGAGAPDRRPSPLPDPSARRLTTLGRGPPALASAVRLPG